ncbi:Eaa1 [Klebsiella pneumoniae]|nr:Eaa1 [Klebsiella pneumoniae]VUG86980.1 Eaa1 [Klebsiella pneumoniae]
MTSKLTRERLQEIAEDGFLKHGESKELARMALAAMDSEPVILYRERNPYNGLTTGWHELTENEFSFLKENAGENAEFLTLYRHAQPAKGLELAGWQFKSVNGDWLGLIDEHGKNQAVRDGCEVREVFAMADGVNDRDQVRREHAEWSQTTFGNVGPIGPLKHLSKEALEAAAEPGDLSEWADMQFLLWDAQRRAGITDEQITLAMIEKLAVNKQREWPEPKDGEPRLHIKEQPAPVVQENSDPRDAFEAAFPMPKHAQRCGDGYAVTSYGAWTAYEFVKKWEGWNACRAAMLQEPQKSAGVSNNCRSNENVQVMHTKSPAQSDCCPAQNQGWIPVSERMPDDEQEVLTINKMGHRFVSFFDKHSGLFFDRLDAPAACCIEHVLVTHWMPLPAAPQEVTNGK